jgi:hypothetical protein
MNHTTQRAIIISMLSALTIAALSVVSSVQVHAATQTKSPLSLTIRGSSVSLGPDGLHIANLPGDIGLDLTPPTQREATSTQPPSTTG